MVRPACWRAAPHAARFRSSGIGGGIVRPGGSGECTCGARSVELPATPEHVTPAAGARVARWLDAEPHGSARASRVDGVYERVVQLAALPDHPLNASWSSAGRRRGPGLSWP